MTDVIYQTTEVQTEISNQSIEAFFVFTGVVTTINGSTIYADISQASVEVNLVTNTVEATISSSNVVNTIMGIPGPTGNTGGTGPTGPAGNDGSVWLNDSGAPSDLEGNNGDYYLDNDTGDYYQKVSGTWGTKLGTFFPPAPRSAVITRDVNDRITSIDFSDATEMVINRTDDLVSSVTWRGYTWTVTRDGNDYISEVEVT